MAQSHDANHAKIRCRTIIEALGNLGLIEPDAES